MKISTKPTNFNELIANKYGKVGSKKRDEFEERAQNFVLSVMLKEARKEAKMTQEEFTIYSNTDRYKSIVERIMQEKFGDNYTDEIIKMMTGDEIGGGGVVSVSKVPSPSR